MAAKRRALFDDATRARAKETIAAVEAQTSAELVIALERASGDYRAEDRLAGALAALFALAVLVFHPVAFDARSFPLEVTLAYLLGALVSSRSSRVRRALAGRRRMRAAVARAARAAFVERGVSRTRARTGILVYLSELEREAELVLDVGVPSSPELAAQAERVREAMRTRNPELVLAAIESLAPLLAAALPRAEDDLNELSDEVEASR